MKVTDHAMKEENRDLTYVKDSWSGLKKKFDPTKKYITGSTWKIENSMIGDSKSIYQIFQLIILLECLALLFDIGSFSI